MEKIERIVMSITGVVLIIIVIFSIYALQTIALLQEKNVLGSNEEKKTVTKKNPDSDKKKSNPTNSLVKQVLADESSIVSPTPTPTNEQSIPAVQKDGRNSSTKSQEALPNANSSGNSVIQVDPTPAIVFELSPTIETPVRPTAKPQPSQSQPQDQENEKKKNENAQEHANVPETLVKIIKEKDLPIKL